MSYKILAYFSKNDKKLGLRSQTPGKNKKSLILEKLAEIKKEKEL